MNIIIAQKYVLVVFIALCYANIGAITINNQNIKKAVKPGQALEYEDIDARNIDFKVENGNLTVGSAGIDNAQEVVS